MIILDRGHHHASQNELAKLNCCFGGGKQTPSNETFETVTTLIKEQQSNKLRDFTWKNMQNILRASTGDGKANL